MAGALPGKYRCMDEEGDNMCLYEICNAVCRRLEYAAVFFDLSLTDVVMGVVSERCMTKYVRS